MKKNVIALILLALAVLAAIGSVTFMGPCVHEDGSEAACTRAGRAILIDSCVLAAVALVILFLRDHSARAFLFAAAAIAAVIGILLPGTLLPLCKMETMHCRMVMQPGTVILSALSLITSAAGLVLELRKNRSSKA